MDALTRMALDKVAIALGRDDKPNFDVAIRILTEAQHERDHPLVSNMLSATGLDLRIVNLLERRLGVWTVPELAAKEWHKIVAIKGLGRKTLQQIDDIRAAYKERQRCAV